MLFMGIPVVEESPSHVKKVIAGYGKAKKKDIKANVAGFFGLAKPGPEHECDAAAFVLCLLVDIGWTGYSILAPVDKEKAKSKRKAKDMPGEKL